MSSLIFAHRGASGAAPENTLDAFALAARMGAHGVELDVHICKSGELVVAHDETVDRVSNGTGRISDLTLSELKALNASVIKGGAFPPERTISRIRRPMKSTVSIIVRISPCSSIRPIWRMMT